jgi:hypothetical protein
MSDPSESRDTLLTRILDKFSNSREFTISFILHVILVAMFGTAVLFEATQEPPDFEGGSGGFVSAGDPGPTAPPQQAQIQPQETTFEVTTQTQVTTNPISAITTTATNPLNFEMTAMIMPSTSTAPPTAAPQVMAPRPAGGSGVDGMTPQVAANIAEFTRGWGTGQGRGTGTRQREFEFFAFIGRYAGGDWNSTVRVQGNQVTFGSLPNLLWWINAKSNNRIKTNDKNVRVIDLSSDEIFSVKPPFIFMTGTRDFRLTEREVETLQRYVRSGGAIWGDSSLPGRNSRFDIAFRREMRRVIPDIDKDFEPLPPNHPIYTAGYFPEIREVPPGVNFYSEPVYALSIYGEIGILYTANDYGDMWQIGLNEKDEVDLRRDRNNNFVAINREIWDNRHLYLGNITPTAGTGRGAQQGVAQNILDTYKFGTNIIVHLLTRWDRVVATAPAL